MNKSFYMEVDLGLMFVGVWFIIMDFFATKIGDLRPGLNRKKDSFYGTGNHRFRRGGYVVICIAVVGFIALLLTPAFTQFPSEGFILKASNLLLGKTRVPWGNVNIFAGVLSLAIGAFLSWAGVEHWKLRHNYLRAKLCFAMGLAFIVEGIIQWPH
jgi:hypothetical protein